MPTYEYECLDCRVRFERKQKVSEKPVDVCPTCNGTTRRVIHPVGVIFTGRGFYSTDHGRPASAPSHGVVIKPITGTDGK